MKNPGVVLALALVAGCAGGGKTSAKLGPTGGTVGDSDGASIAVPSGAVGGDTDFTVTSAPNAPAPSNATEVGTPYTLGPEGATFEQPVTVTLAVDTSKLPSGRTISDVAIYTAPAGTSSYTRLATTVVDPTHVSAKTLHFSTFVPGVSTKCAVTCGVGMSASTGGGTGGGGVDAGTTAQITCGCSTTCNADGSPPAPCSASTGGGSGGSGGSGGTGGTPPSCMTTGISYGVLCNASGCTCTPSGTASLSCTTSTTPEQIFAAYQACGGPGELVTAAPVSTTGSDAGTNTGGTGGSMSGCMAPDIGCGAACSIMCTGPQVAMCIPGIMSGPGVCSSSNSCFCQ